MEYQNLLVFLEFPDPDRPSLGLLKSLSYMDVTLVGFHPTPEDGELAEDEVADIDATLAEIAAEFEERGIRVERHVVTGESMIETRDEWASRDEIDGVLLPHGVGTVGRIMVGVRGTQNIETMADFVDFIDRERIIRITLLHVAPESNPEDTLPGREALDTMKAELTDRGVNPAAIDSQIRVSDDPERQLIQTARRNDLTVLGKTREPDLRDRIFGPISNRVAERANSSVLIVH